MVALFLIVFVGMMGTSLLAPLIPFYAARLGLTPEYITVIIGFYALCQFVAAPMWGQISDRYGRKPVLLITSAGSCFAFLLLAYADSVWVLILSRAIGGICAGNLATAYAYVTDVTTPENRASGMGKVGAAFGLGFVLGPALGGFLAGGENLMNVNFLAPALGAASIAALAFLCALFFLTESRKIAADQPKRKTSLNPLGRFDVVAGNHGLLLVLILSFILLLASSVREATIALWAHDQFALSSKQLGFLFAYTGLIITALQGAVLGGLSRRFGEENVLIGGILAYAAGLASFVLIQNYESLIIGTTLNAIGTAVFSNALPTVSSKMARTDQRGLVLGVCQSTGSLARFIGPSFAGSLYAYIAITAPFAFGAAILAVGLVLAVVIRHHIKASRQ
ncbi:MAG: MFS transporter [Rhodospirillaceae bacterium]|nr:MFS transporter [Rhodospirillaceae bacterium]